MAQVIKLLWRLDYNVSYSYIDKRGEALRLLSETVKDYWSSIGAGTIPYSFVAQHTETPEGQRNLSLEPTSMNGSIEWVPGAELERVLQTDAFRGTTRIVHELLKLADIKIMARVGIRFWCVAKFADGRSNAMGRTSKLFDQDFYQTAVKCLGPINDLGLVFEGKTDDEIGYRAIFGPYARKNVDLTLQKKPSDEAYRLLDENDLFFDIDMFEHQLSFVEHSLFRWSNTKLAKATEFIALLEKSTPIA